jgi:hypothetical protein
MSSPARHHMHMVSCILYNCKLPVRRRNRLLEQAAPLWPVYADVYADADLVRICEMLAQNARHGTGWATRHGTALGARQGGAKPGHDYMLHS